MEKLSQSGVILEVGTFIRKYVSGYAYMITGYRTFQGENMYTLDTGTMLPVSAVYYVVS